MREERNPVPRAQNPWGWLGGILALGVLMAGAVAGALALWENVDIQRLTRAPGDIQPLALPDPVSPSEPARSDGGFGVALYASEATARYFPERSFYPSILEGWEALIRTAGGSPRRVASAAEVLALGGRGAHRGSLRRVPRKRGDPGAANARSERRRPPPHLGHGGPKRGLRVARLGRRAGVLRCG